MCSSVPQALSKGIWNSAIDSDVCSKTQSCPASGPGSFDHDAIALAATWQTGRLIRLLLFLVVLDASVLHHGVDEIARIKLETLSALLFQRAIAGCILILNKLFRRGLLLLENLEHCSITLNRNRSADLVFAQCKRDGRRSAHRA